MSRHASVTVAGVSKKFVTSMRRAMAYGVKDIACELLGASTRSGHLRRDEFWAVKDVSFELKAGDSIGIVGPNGAGKSTLLKMLNGIIKPDRGSIRIQGRVAALIEVGAGFHPMLSGRENIYINGAILGMTTSEIKRKFDSIVDFAEIGNFIDLPVKYYSSGMYVRLGFAVAAHGEPDILLVDEILSVGDLSFRQKCFRYFEKEILGGGVTLCLVSHSVHAITRLCSKAILLDQGSVCYSGSAQNIVSEYYKMMAPTSPGGHGGEDTGISRRYGAGEVRVLTTEILNSSGEVTDTIQVGESICFRFKLVANRGLPLMPQVFFKLKDLSETPLVSSVVPGSQLRQMSLEKGLNVLIGQIKSVNLMPGCYKVEIKIGGADDLCQDFFPEAATLRVLGTDDVYASTSGAGVVYLEGHWNVRYEEG